jgi:hypothetical protein
MAWAMAMAMAMAGKPANDSKCWQMTANCPFLGPAIWNLYAHVLAT